MKLFERIACDAPLFLDGTLETLVQECHRLTVDHLQAAEHPFFARIREQMRPVPTHTEDGIAIIPVQGPLASKPSWLEMLMGIEDSQTLLGLVEEAAHDKTVKGILLSIDSPGGFYTGGPELADAVRQSSQRKPVVAHTTGTMASLAYMIGSQATRAGAGRSAQVGSIGVLAAHVDRSRLLDSLGIKVEIFRNKEAEYKAAGTLGTALTEPQRDYLQERVQTAFKEFAGMVRRKRTAVPDEAMRGQVFNGLEAKKLGLVDFVGGAGYALGTLRREVRQAT